MYKTEKPSITEVLALSAKQQEIPGFPLDMEYGESLANNLSIWQRVWRARLYPGFRDKVTHMVIDYLQEASVLVSVLGILDFVITWRQQPTLKVIAWSLGIALTLLGLAVIIQAANEPDPKDISLGATASNLEGEGRDNA